MKKREEKKRVRLRLKRRKKMKRDKKEESLRNESKSEREKYTKMKNIYIIFVPDKPARSEHKQQINKH